MLRTKMRTSDKCLYLGGCAILFITSFTILWPAYVGIITTVLALVGATMIIASIIRDMRYMHRQNT